MLNQKKKILIADDEEVLVQMYKRKFEKAGYKVLEAFDGDDVVKILNKETPDIILLDVIMPKMDGFLILEKLKSNPKTKKIPVILLTNLAQKEDIKKGLKIGADSYLVKSELTPQQVLDTIQRFLK